MDLDSRAGDAAILRHRTIGPNSYRHCQVWSDLLSPVERGYG